MATETTYLALLRGINVGGKNKVPMAKLKAMLEELGFGAVTTWIQSGNAIFRSTLTAGTIAKKTETALTSTFKLDSDLIRVLVLSHAELKSVVSKRPKGFGDEPETYHSDAIFLMDLALDEALAAFSPRECVDSLWPGPAMVYHQRLSAQRTKTHLNRAMAHPAYKSMTIRSWQTTLKLLELMDAAAS
jgi:uncharacterized protein (DUF1697 family)